MTDALHHAQKALNDALRLLNHEGPTPYSKLNEAAAALDVAVFEIDNQRIHPSDAFEYVKRRKYKKQDVVVRELNEERESVFTHNVYHVKTNDTLSEIVQRFEGASIGVMMRINNIADADVIYAGATLNVYPNKVDMEAASHYKP